MTKDQIINKFKTLPSADSSEYTVNLKNIVQKNNLIEDEVVLVTIIESAAENVIRFASFYALLIAYREYGSISKYIELVDKYGELFSEEKLYNIVLSTYYRNKVLLGDKSAGRLSIAYADAACSDFKNSFAVKHHYSETVAYMAESEIAVTSEDITAALRYVEEVILQVPNHSVYYCTKGRLLAITHDYSKANYYLNRAIDLEKADTKDAVIRIGKFNHYLTAVQLQQNEEALRKQYNIFSQKLNQDEEKIDNLIQTVNDLQTKYLEYLAFFSAIIAFIMVSVNVVVKIENYYNAIGLIITLAGVLILTFIVFRMILPSTRNETSTKRYIFCIIVAIIFFIIGGVLGMLCKP